MSTLLKDTEINELKIISEEKGLFIRLDEADSCCSCLNKVNFVDTNNRLVGLELAQECCETVYWYVELNDGDKTNTINAESPYNLKAASRVENDLLRYSKKVIHTAWFLPNVFFDDKDPVVKSVTSDGDGGIATWDLVNDKGEYVGKLVIENDHEGYYSHGFYDVRDGQEAVYNTI